MYPSSARAGLPCRPGLRLGFFFECALVFVCAPEPADAPPVLDELWANSPAPRRLARIFGARRIARPGALASVPVSGAPGGDARRREHARDGQSAAAMRRPAEMPATARGRDASAARRI